MIHVHIAIATEVIPLPHSEQQACFIIKHRGLGVCIFVFCCSDGMALHCFIMHCYIIMWRIIFSADLLLMLVLHVCVPVHTLNGVTIIWAGLVGNCNVKRCRDRAL